MKLTDVGSSEQDVERYINSVDWIMQQKFDGTRVQVTLNDAGDFFWSNDGVKSVTHSAAKLKIPALEELLRDALADFNGMLTLEGELLIRTGEYVLWDIIPSENRFRVPNVEAPWRHRHEALTRFHGLLPNEATQLIKVSPTAYTAESKREMWEIINATNVEGAVSKHIDSFYVPGVRTREWVKHKLVKTADLVVMTAIRTMKPGNIVVEKGSAGLGYHDEAGNLVSVCSASLIGRDLSIAPGDVVEVNYLYRETGGGGLVQPRITRKRWDAATETGDKEPFFCTEDQFPEYSRQVVTI